MTRICNFPIISKSRRCKQPVADDKPNCGRHKCEISADQLGQSPTVYKKDGELHVWADKPDDVYCLIHSDPVYQVLYQVAREKPPCCLREDAEWKDEHGQPHRDDGPALIWHDGTLNWYQYGKLHRDDGPAIVRLDGTQRWFRHGERHRDDGPAEIRPDGMQVWWQHGKLHRYDGPAVIRADGTQSWYQRDKCHRTDGPAVIRADGTQEWYWKGRPVTKEEHAELQERSKDV